MGLRPIILKQLPLPHSMLLSMRITALLQKIHELAGKPDEASAIDIDLMLDYTRVLYSDLLEWRKNAEAPKMPEPAVAAAQDGGTGTVAAGGMKPLHVAEPREEPAQLNGHEQETPKVVMPLSSPGSPVVQQTSVQFAAPEVEEAEPEEPKPAPTPKELTLEEYLARQRESDRETDDTDEREDEAPIAAPTRAPQPVTTTAAAPPPVPVARVGAPAVTPLPAPPPSPRDIRTMIGINDKYQIMSELFGNDKAAYEQALDVINRAESEQAAFNWLRERLWVTEDHSDAAMIFFDVVRRFKNG